MTSMIHSRSYNPVLFQKIRVSTELYGVVCNVYAPQAMEQGFMNYSDIVYENTVLLSTKFLIPKAVILRSQNAFTEVGFLEEDANLWSTTKIPKYSKIIVVESTEVLSFLVTDIETTEDPRFNEMYYKYTLVPSSSVTAQTSSTIAAVASAEEDFIVDNPKFDSSISDVNKQSANTPSTAIKVGKL